MTSLTPRERATMVNDLNHLAEKYHRASRNTTDIDTATFCASMSHSFSALADAIKQERRFEAVA